ncbi:MAG: ester cyclase, partial [Thermoplasmata archaeon]
REAAEMFVTAFPDARSKKERSFGQGDWVCQEYTITGTHTGPLKGPGGEAIPATNQPVRLRGCGVYKFEGGEITEEHDYSDSLGMMAQLGLAP